MWSSRIGHEYSSSGPIRPSPNEKISLVLTDMSECRDISTAFNGESDFAISVPAIKGSTGPNGCLFAPVCNFKGYVEHLQGNKTSRYPVSGSMTAYHVGHLSTEETVEKINGEGSEELLKNVDKIGLHVSEVGGIGNPNHSWFERSLRSHSQGNDHASDGDNADRSLMTDIRFPIKNGLPPNEGRSSLAGEKVDTTLNLALSHGKTRLGSSKGDRKTIPGLSRLFNKETILTGNSTVGMIVSRSLPTEGQEPISDDQMISDGQAFHRRYGNECTRREDDGSVTVTVVWRA
ncbi:hypothetical protein V866_004193 [Kwoniella sp. B9012]